MTSSQSPAGNHQRSQPTSHGLVSPSSSPQSATRVNTAPVVSERPSVKLKAVGGKSNILNSAVVNAAGQSLYLISGDSKRTTMVACKDNVKVATVEWNRSSPRMTFRQKKMKCKEWLPFARPDTEYKRPSLPSCAHSESDTASARILTHGDSQFIWINKSSTSGYVSTVLGNLCDGLIKLLQLIPANRPGLSVARWRIRIRSDDLDLEIFQEALVESGLLEAIVVSIALLRSGHSFSNTTRESGTYALRYSSGMWPAMGS
jgi:hypothetical protein